MPRQVRTAVNFIGANVHTAAVVLRRTCACGQHAANGEECEECKKSQPTLQRQASRNSRASIVPSSVYDVLHSSGQPLDRSVRTFMEPSFGYDFSRVRIHNDNRAAASARAVDAVAYTVGRNIVFGSGQYQPGTTAGRRLLAHELTHVVQQDHSGSNSLQHLQVGPSDDPLEREAHSVANSVVAGIRPNSVLPSDLMVRRAETGSAVTAEKECPQKVNKEGSALCSAYGNQQALETNANFCRDTESTGSLHKGFTCYREVHKGSGCPPGKHICFTRGGCCASETHVDSTAPSLKRRKDGYCDISWLGLCSILHGIKDVVPWKKIGIVGAGIGLGAGLGAIAGGGPGAALGAGVGALAGGFLSDKV